MHDYIEFISEKFKGKYSKNQTESVCQLHNGTIKGIQIEPGLSILLNKLSLQDKISYDQKLTSGYVKVSFYRKANSMVHNSEGAYLLSDNSFKIDFFDHSDRITLESLSEEFESIDIFIRKGLLRNVISNEETLEQDLRVLLLDLINGKRRYKMFPTSLKVTQLLNEIWENKSKGILQLLNVQKLVCEVLSMLLTDFYDAWNEEQTISLEDKNIVETAKSILDNNFWKPPTIKELSKLVAVNECRLKKSFKEHYKTTIYQYIIKIRMERSKTMVTSGEYSINEVADQIGYNNTSKFITAFKKEFGLTPGKFKR